MKRLLKHSEQISIPPNQTLAFTELIYKNPPVQLCGLGARDSLRIEAGMCLYGHDIDETTSVAEAGLSWVIGKLIGTWYLYFANAILSHLQANLERKTSTVLAPIAS